MRERGLHFVGAGISGGEEGALNGPSIMPGGPAESYKSLGPLLEEISAHVDGVPCCTHIGPDGAGPLREDGAQRHRVLRHAADRRGLPAAARRARARPRAEIADVFAEWNKGDLDSYLIEITAEVLRQIDAKTGKPLVDVILDEAEQKGTGRWTVQVRARPRRARSPASPRRCSPARCRVRSPSARPPPGWRPATSAKSPATQRKFIEDVRQALYASKIIAYAQGFNQIQAGSAEYDWDITPGDMATIWRGGCIIRAKFLNRIKEAFDEDADLPTLIVAPYFRSAVEAAIDSWRRVVVTATAAGHPDPRLLLGAVLLRRAAHRAAARRADPGPARLLRRAHLRPHRRRPEQAVPHAVERRPQRSRGLTARPRLDGRCRFLDGHRPPYDLTYNDVFIVPGRSDVHVAVRRRPVDRRRLGHHHPGGGGQHDRGGGPPDGRDGGPPRRHRRSAAGPSDLGGQADGRLRQEPRPGRRHPGDAVARRFGVRRDRADPQARARRRRRGRSRAGPIGLVTEANCVGRRPVRPGPRHRGHRFRHRARRAPTRARCSTCSNTRRSTWR